MDTYQTNRSCFCARCRTRGLMGPVVLVVLGVLFLISEWTPYHFHQTWPILLIAIGVVKVLGSSADTSGHVDDVVNPPGTLPPPPAPPAGNEGERPQQVEHV